MCCQSHKSSIASSPEVLKWRNWKPPTHIAPSRGDTEAHIARLLVSTLGLHCGNAMVLAVEIASFEKRPTTAPPQLEDKLYFLGKQRKLAIEKSARFAALASLPPFLSIRPPPGSQIPATTKLPLTLRAALIPQPRLAGTRPARSGGPCQAGEGARFLTPACIAEHCGAPLCRHRPNRQISLQASYYQQSMAWTFCVQWPQVFICCTDLYIIQSLYDTACPPVEDS